MTHCWAWALAHGRGWCLRAGTVGADGGGGHAGALRAGEWTELELFEDATPPRPLIIGFQVTR